MEHFVPPFLECITEERSAVLLEAWRQFKGIPALAELMRIGNQLGLDFRVVRYWFYCRANYKGLARAFDTLGPQQRLELPKLEEYYLFDRFSDDLDDLDDPDPSTDPSTEPSADQFIAHFLGPANDASFGPSQPIQSAHAQPESSSSVFTPGRLRRASTTAKKQPQKPSSLRTKRQQRPPTQEPSENGKRRQDPASDDREVRAASKARTKRNKTTTEALPEATTQSTTHALGRANDASPGPSQPVQPAHAQLESSSSVSASGRLRRACTTAKTQSQKPSTPRTKRQQRPSTQESNENGKRRQDPASDDREVRAASKARAKRSKTTTEALPEATIQSTTLALGPANDASPGSSQPVQPAHAQPESSSSVSASGRLRRACTMAKAQPQKPSTPRTKRQQRPSTQESNENGKRRQDPASDDREVRAASKARAKRNKTTPKALPEAAPAAPSAAASGTTEPALTPSDDMDNVAADSASSRENSGEPDGRWFLEAVVIPPFRHKARWPQTSPSSSSSRSPSPSPSGRRCIATLRLPLAALPALALDSAVSGPAIETATTDALTSESSDQRPFELNRDRMEPPKPSRRASQSDGSINSSTSHARADPAAEQEVVQSSDENTTAAALAQNARSKAKSDMGSKRRADAAMASSDSDPNTASTETQSKTRSKSAPLSGSRAGEPESPTQPESPNLREQVLQDSDQDHVTDPDSGSPPHTTGVAPVPVEEETLDTRAGARMTGEAEDKEVMAREDQGEGHLGTVHSTPSTSSRADSSPQTTTLTTTETRAVNDAVQGHRQNERLPEHPQSTRLSRSRSRGPSTAPTPTASQVPSQTQAPPQPQVPGPIVQAVIESIRIMTEQYDVAMHRPENESTGPATPNTDPYHSEPAAPSKRQQDGSASTQLMWDQPWTKHGANIKPMKRRSTVTETGVVPSPSKPSQSTSKTSSSNSINMVPNERLASEKIIISMDQTPSTPKSTDDADRQARTAQNSNLEQIEDAEITETPLTPVFSNEVQYMEAQTDEMIAGGSSYSPDATYDCFSPTNPYHSDDSWSKDLELDNDMSPSPANRGHNRKNFLATDDQDAYRRSRRGDRRSRRAGRSRRSRKHDDHSRDRGYRRRTHRPSDRTGGRSRDRYESQSSKAHRSRDRSNDRTLDRPGKALDKFTERSRDYANRSYHSNDRRSRDRSRDRFEGHRGRL